MSRMFLYVFFPYRRRSPARSSYKRAVTTVGAVLFVTLFSSAFVYNDNASSQNGELVISVPAAHLSQPSAGPRLDAATGMENIRAYVPPEALRPAIGRDVRYTRADSVYTDNTASISVEDMNEEEIISYYDDSSDDAQAPAQRVNSRLERQRRNSTSYGRYIWPANGYVTSPFGPREISTGPSLHRGIDIAGIKDQPIYAADGGVVIFSGLDEMVYGYYIMIRHDNGDITLYAHNSYLLVKEGENVWQGREIALMGDTGNAVGVHLHFELIINGVKVDPMEYLP